MNIQMPWQCKEGSLSTVTEAGREKNDLFRGKGGKTFQADGPACAKSGVSVNRIQVGNSGVFYRVGILLFRIQGVGRGKLKVTGT